MYALHRLSRDSQDYVASFLGTARARSDQFSMAVAFVLAGKVSLAKEDSRNFFTGDNRTVLLSKLSSLNEILRIDADKILDYGRKILAYRAFQFDGTVVLGLSNAENAVSEFFGISRFFSQEDMEVIKSGGVKMSYDVERLTNLLIQLGVINANS